MSAAYQPIAAGAVLGRVCAVFRVSREELCGARRFGLLVAARQAAMAVLHAREAPGGTRSLEMIGRLLGGRDHSTVSHGIRAAHDRAARDPAFGARLDHLLAWDGVESLSGSASPDGSATSAGCSASPDGSATADGFFTAFDRPVSLIEQARAHCAAREVREGALCDDDRDAHARLIGTLRLAQALAKARGVAA